MQQALAKKKEQQAEHKEQLDRLTAPTHATFSHFLKHDAIAGYFEREDSPMFMGCDRLLKLENIYGRLQMGYDPKKGVAFLFAHLKTNVYDTVSSSYQRQMNDRSRVMMQKNLNENVAFNARRKKDTSVILYKRENKPWSERSVRPYLLRHNAGALRKTMPFLNVAENRVRLQALYDRQRKQKTERSEDKETDKKIESHKAERVTETWREIERENVIIWRKEQQSKLFFRKMNYAFDIQKHEMFDYYREKRKKMELEAENDTTAEPTSDGNGGGDDET